MKRIRRNTRAWKLIKIIYIFTILSLMLSNILTEDFEQSKNLQRLQLTLHKSSNKYFFLCRRRRRSRYIEILLIIICICYTLFIVAVVVCFLSVIRALLYKANGVMVLLVVRRSGGRMGNVQRSRYNSYAMLTSLFLARIFIAVTWDFVYVTIAFCFTVWFLHTLTCVFIYLLLLFSCFVIIFWEL